MKKIIFAGFIITSSLSAAVWSSTQMQIATTALTPFITTQMSTLTTKVAEINTKYAADAKQQIILKETTTREIRNLENEILLELKKMKFNQTYLNRIVAAE